MVWTYQNQNRHPLSIIFRCPLSIFDQYFLPNLTIGKTASNRVLNKRHSAFPVRRQFVLIRRQPVVIRRQLHMLMPLRMNMYIRTKVEEIGFSGGQFVHEWTLGMILLNSNSQAFSQDSRTAQLRCPFTAPFQSPPYSAKRIHLVPIRRQTNSPCPRTAPFATSHFWIVLDNL